MHILKKILFGCVILSVVLIAITFWRLGHQEGDENPQTTQNESQDQANNSPETSEQPEEKKLVVSDSELLRLKNLGVVSPDEKYYIRNVSVGFPKIVSLETGEEYNFKPGANYTQVKNVTWSADGKVLVYLFQVPDEMYLGLDIINKATIDEVLSQKFPNAGRILTAGYEMKYVWLNGKEVLYSAMQNYDAEKKYYLNGDVGSYNVETETFGYPWGGEYAERIYSIEISPNKDKFLYAQAVLDEDGMIKGRQYVTVDYNGKVLKTTQTYVKEWYK